MPMYEYQCKECRHIFEARQKYNDTPLSACPECGGVVEKLISRTAFTLKGGGWYEQGYSEKPACSSGDKTPACNGCPKAANE